MPYKDATKRRDYSRGWIAERKQKYLHQLGECYFCGSAENIEPHHVDPDEKLDTHFWSWEESRLLHELYKCVALCGSCHKKFHGLVRRIAMDQSGETTGYRRGCRCQICKTAKADEYQARKAAGLTV